MGLRRKMLPDERKRFENDFPRMNLDQAIVTGPQDPIYNCMAWTFGVENDWIWPETRGTMTTKERLDPWYFNKGYITDNKWGNVAVWGHKESGLINHVSVVLREGWLESKLDADLRVIHKATDLGNVPGNKSRYGDIQILYYYLLKPKG